jgi:16S rRNA (cytosine1407-C5)-methyltransferase
MVKKDTANVDPLSWAQAYLSPAEYQILLNGLNQSLDISIRINTLKADPESAIAKWSALYGWKTEPVPFCPSGFWIRSFDTPPSTTIEHRLGYFYIQEAASMLPPELFDLAGMPDPLVLDMAASPGGKTTHLAALSGDTGLVIANDGSRSRIPALQIVLRNWGATNQAIICLPGEAFGGLYPDTFDAVLLDAPCSMQGLRSAESHTSRTITLNEIDSLAARQLRLLESALRAAKPGGQIVYSTCTLAPQEDELVLAALLERFPRQVRIEDVSARLPVPAPAIIAFDGRELPQQIRHALRLWPHTLGSAGFFAARLTKTDHMPKAAGFSARIPPADMSLKPILRKDRHRIVQVLNDFYSFDLEDTLEKGSLEVVLHKEQYHLVPAKLTGSLLYLPVLSAGLPLGKPFNEGLQISHEFASRFGDRFKSGVLLLEDESLLSWLRGEDIRGYRCEGAQTGEIYAVRDRLGRNLGRGKLSESRLKNMLPTRLF